MASQPVSQALAREIDPLVKGVVEVSDEVSTSASSTSLPSCTSDSESDLGLTNRTEEEVKCNASDEQASAERKRRKVDGAKGCDSSSLRPPESTGWTGGSDTTLIILDWDDTLLPSSWLQDHGLNIAAGSAQPDLPQRLELAKVAQNVITTLQRLKNLGHVMIVTNAEKGWVELSCRKFLPEVAPLLEGMKLLSARSAYEHVQPESPVDWKRLAFSKEITDFVLRSSDGGQPFSLVSVGDSMSERTALLDAAVGRSNCWAKSLKFMELPTPEQIIRQHELLCGWLDQVVEHQGALDLCFQVPS